MNLINIIGYIGAAGTALLSVWAIFRYFLFGSYRLDNDMSKRLIDLITKRATFKWVMTDEYVREPKFPDTYEALVKINGFFLYFVRAERLLTAGWKGKEEVTVLYFCRWRRNDVIELFEKSATSPTVAVMALTPHGSDRLGELSCDANLTTILRPELYQDIEADVADIAEKKIGKTSFLLYGAPGNGKSQFIKYLARKYALPVNVVYLHPEYSNLDIATMFASVPPNSIVLFEDFDSYFDGRECIIKNDQLKFTFDAIINALDGVHNDYRGNVFVMTANSIDMVDDSLKSRPSRFKFVREFGNPAYSTRLQILGDEELSRVTEGMSLDKVFACHKSPALAYAADPVKLKKVKRGKKNV